MRFVTPEVVRIPLKDGVNWIEIKKELTVGEDKKYRTAGFHHMTPGTEAAARDGGKPATEAKDPKIEVDWARQALARVEMYLTDWSATREIKGKVTPIAVSRQNIEALDQESFDEIDQLIQDHIAAMDAEKKATPGSQPPEPPTP